MAGKKVKGKKRTHKRKQKNANNVRKMPNFNDNSNLGEVYYITRKKIIPARNLTTIEAQDLMNPPEKPRNLTTIEAQALTNPPEKQPLANVQPTAYFPPYSVSGPQFTRPQYTGPGPVFAINKGPAGVPKSFLLNSYRAALHAGVRPNQPAATTTTPQFAGQSPFDYNPVQPSTDNRPTYEFAQPEGNDNTPTASTAADAVEAGDTLYDPHEGSESPDLVTGQKRLSAFDRLGPINQAKKPKLTINLSFNKEKAVRQVVDTPSDDKTDPHKYTKVHEKPYIIESKDDIVQSFLEMWPWKKNISIHKEVTLRSSKSVMMMESEKMEKSYAKYTVFFQIRVKGYPLSWTKEDVLDVILDNLKGKSFIPCMVDFSQTACRFLVMRCRDALVGIHKHGFCIRKDDVELVLSISTITPDKFHFLPRLVLRKIMSRTYDDESKLSLKEFTLQKDLSHCIYYPLNRLTNQAEIIQMESDIVWNYLTHLDLSHNRITTLDGFDLSRTTPKLKHLDLSHNRMEKITVLLNCRELSLHSLKLEGNPLCLDYIDAGHYVKAAKMIYPTLKELDGVPIKLSGELPTVKRNYCPESAEPIVERFLEVYFPLFESDEETRLNIKMLYRTEALLTISFNDKMRYTSNYRYCRSLFNRARDVIANDYTCIESSTQISKHISKWPMIEHDRSTITIDVMFHNETSTIFRMSGLLKTANDSLAEDEVVIAFTRTIVLVTVNQIEYKIANEMVYWDLPTAEYAALGFRITTVKPSLSLQMESTPDEDLKHKLCQIFVKLTDLNEDRSRRCLETKEWNLKEALAHFIKLLKLDSLDALDIKNDAVKDLN